MKKHFSFFKFNAVEMIPPLLVDGLIISFIVHVFVLVLIMISPYVHIKAFVPKIKYDEPIIIDLENVEVKKQTVLPPAPATKTQPKQVEKKEAPAPKVEKKEPVHYTPEVAKPTPVEEKVEKQQTEDKKSDSDFITEKKEVKKEEKPKENKNLAQERMGSLNDLLASVDGLKREKDTIK